VLTVKCLLPVSARSVNNSSSCRLVELAKAVLKLHTIGACCSCKRVKKQPTLAMHILCNSDRYRHSNTSSLIPACVLYCPQLYQYWP